MKLHDPYGPILEVIRQKKSQQEYYAFLEKMRDPVTDLRLRYDGLGSNVNFNNDLTRTAYLLSYFPYYIEPIYSSLCDVDPSITTSCLGNKEISAAFLGAGPAPELLGLVSFLNDNQHNTKELNAYFFDKYSDSWGEYQELTCQTLGPIYWPGGHVNTKRMNFDFHDMDAVRDTEFQNTIKNCDLIVIQNCLNDHIKRIGFINEFLQSVFLSTKPGSLFVIMDLNYDPIRVFMKGFSSWVEKGGRGYVELEVSDEPRCMRSNIYLHSELKSHLFIDDAQKHLCSKEKTEYYSAVISRNG